MTKIFFVAAQCPPHLLHLDVLILHEGIVASGPKVLITLGILSAQIEKIFVELDHPRSLGLGGHYKISEAVWWSAAAETVLTILTRIHVSTR